MMGCNSRGIPNRNTEWVHRKNQIRYMVFDILNDEAAEGRNDEYPITVCYIGENGKKWGKPLANFLEKMECVESQAYPMSWTGRTPWIPYLVDRADGVKGHYAIGRWNPAGYQEVWNLHTHEWGAFSDDVLTLANTLELLKELRIPTGEPVKSQWNSRRERINAIAASAPPYVEVLAQRPLDFPPLKINVTNDEHYKATEGLWYFIDIAELDSDAARDAIVESMRTAGALAGFRTSGSPFDKMVLRRGLNQSARDQIAEANMNYVGNVGTHGPVIWGNRTARGGLLPELVLVVTVLHEVGRKAHQLMMTGNPFDLSAWATLESRANEILADFIRARRLPPNGVNLFHFSARNCVLHMTFPWSALLGDTLGTFEINATVERDGFSFNLDRDLANLIDEVVSLDWILMG